MTSEDVTPPPGGQVWDGEPPWEAWHPADAARVLEGVEASWCVAGGWAVDLWHGRTTREHEDLEIAVPRAGFGEIRAAFSGLEFDVVGAGQRWPLDSPAFDVMDQTWGREPAVDVYRIDVFRDRHEGDTWIFKRDETIRLPYDRMIRRTADGVPFQSPEVVLLFKAKHVRAKDELDFSGLLPTLDREQRDWLVDALRRVHPGHSWIDHVESHERG